MSRNTNRDTRYNMCTCTCEHCTRKCYCECAKCILSMNNNLVNNKQTNTCICTNYSNTNMEISCTLGQHDNDLLGDDD